jgi:hypothetical protein
MGNVELAAFVKRQDLMFKAVKPARFCGSNHFDAGASTCQAALCRTTPMFASLRMFLLFTGSPLHSYRCLGNVTRISLIHQYADGMTVIAQDYGKTSQ